jgi:hypothetical protein
MVSEPAAFDDVGRMPHSRVGWLVAAVGLLSTGTARADDAARAAAIETCAHQYVHQGYPRPFAENELQNGRDALALCKDKWSVCAPKVKAALGDMNARAAKVQEVAKDISDHNWPCDPMKLNPVIVRQLTVWCGGGGGNGVPDCLKSIDEVDGILAATNEAGSCAFNEGFYHHQRELCEQKIRQQEDQAKLDETRRQQAETRRVQQEEQRRVASEQRDAQIADSKRVAAEQAAEETRKREEAEALREKRIALQHEQEAAASTSNSEYVGTLTNVMASGSGGGNHPTGGSWHVHLGIGAGMYVLPLFKNSAAISDSMYMLAASTDPGMIFTVGPSMSLEVWPYYGPHLGVAVHGSGQFGAMALPGGGMLSWGAGGGIKAFVGKTNRWMLFGEGAVRYRSEWLSQAASYDPILEGAADGSAGFRLDEYGAGLRWCMSNDGSDDRFCDSEMTFEVLRQSFDYSPDTAQLYRLELRAHRIVDVQITAGFDIPTPGENDYGGSGDHQFQITANIEWSFDWFGQGGANAPSAPAPNATPPDEPAAPAAPEPVPEPKPAAPVERVEPARPPELPLVNNVLRGFQIGQRVRVERTDGSAVEGPILEVDDSHIVLQGTRHNLATPANEVSRVTPL